MVRQFNRLTSPKAGCLSNEIRSEVPWAITGGVDVLPNSWSANGVGLPEAVTHPS